MADPDEQQVLAALLRDEAAKHLVTVKPRADGSFSWGTDSEFTERDPTPICLGEVPEDVPRPREARRIELQLSPIRFSADGTRAQLMVTYTCRWFADSVSGGYQLTALTRSDVGWRVDPYHSVVFGHCP